MELISTANIPVGERFAFWREINTKLWAPYDLRCDREREDGFQAQVGVCDFGAVQATLMTTMPHEVHRTPKLIRRADPEVFKLGCFVRGRNVVVQDNRCTTYGVGDLKLYDTSRPFGGEFAPDVAMSQLLLLRFPRSLLPLPAGDLRRLTSMRIPGAEGVGALSSQFLLHLAKHLHELSSADAARLSLLTVDVLAAALAHALDAQGGVPPETRRRALVARLDAFIEQNLGDAHLTPETIAAAHHISLRYLHKVFHEDGRTVAEWIRHRRLEHCRRDLADPRFGSRPISAIAAGWGFGNAAHFSHTFRRAYGLAPREFRRQRAAGHAG